MRALRFAQRGARKLNRNSALTFNIQRRTFAGACFPTETRELTDWRGLIEYEDAWSNILFLSLVWVQFFSAHFMTDRWFLENELQKLEEGFVMRPGSFKQHSNPNNYVPTFPDEESS